MCDINSNSVQIRTHHCLLSTFKRKPENLPTPLAKQDSTVQAWGQEAASVDFLLQEGNLPAVFCISSLKRTNCDVLACEVRAITVHLGKNYPRTGNTDKVNEIISFLI